MDKSSRDNGLIMGNYYQAIQDGREQEVKDRLDVLRAEIEKLKTKLLVAQGIIRKVRGILLHGAPAPIKTALDCIDDWLDTLEETDV